MSAGRCVQPSEAGGERELRVSSKKMSDLISRLTMSVAVREVVFSKEMLEFTLFCKKKSGRDAQKMEHLPPPPISAKKKEQLLYSLYIFFC